jgi:hypothetical protein
MSTGLEIAKSLFGRMAPLSQARNPQAAALLGFLFGGIGLGVYFRSFVDFLVPILITVLVFMFVPAVLQLDEWTAMLLGSIISALWGYFRALDSNARQAVAQA